jgi:heme-degrading monooxygenase HmoA
MHARVTQFEIDVVVISIPRAVERFKELVLPELRQQPGYAGICVLANEQGRGMLVSYWSSEQAAERAVTSGFYDQQIQKFVTFYRQPPGREHFEVSLLEIPGSVAVA